MVGTLVPLPPAGAARMGFQHACALACTYAYAHACMNMHALNDTSVYAHTKQSTRVLISSSALAQKGHTHTHKHTQKHKHKHTCARTPPPQRSQRRLRAQRFQVRSAVAAAVRGQLLAQAGARRVGPLGGMDVQDAPARLRARKQVRVSTRMCRVYVSRCA